MSYYYKNKVYSYYQITDSSTGTSSLTKDVIEIINNEKILFDFSSLVVHASSVGVLNFSDVETIKIHIDWGDGTSDRLAKPLISNKSSIGVYRPNQWKAVEHLFNVKKRYEYKTDDAKSLHHIVITAYNSFNDKFVITIPYKVLYKTLYELGSELSLFSANITNDNRVSYTLKQNGTDSLFIAMTKDWKSIYGDTDVEVIEEKKVSELFSEDYINEDEIIWDWKTVPTISMTIHKASSGILATFRETGISIDQWEPLIVFPSDYGDQVIKTEKSPNSYSFWTDEQSLQPGIYAISVNPIVGINGAVGSSDVKYFSYNVNSRPRDLMAKSSNTPIVVDNTNKKITFNYNLKPYQQVRNLTKANLILTAQFKDAKYQDQDISEIKFSYDVLANMLDKNGYPISPTVASYDIPMRNIPNVAWYDNNAGVSGYKPIQYNVQVVTNDVFGGEDNTIFYKYLSNLPYDFSPFSFDYDIGHFTTNYSFDIYNQNQITKEVPTYWEFVTNDVWGEFRLRLVSKDGVVLVDNVYKHASGNDFNGLTTVSSSETEDGLMVKYQTFIDGNKIPNGYIDWQVDYNVHMADYYDTRTKTVMGTSLFTYLCPELVMDGVPFTQITYNTLTNAQSLSLAFHVYCSYVKEPLKNREVTLRNLIGEDGKTYDKTIPLSSLDYVHTFPSTEFASQSLIFKAANENDNYNRMGQVGCTLRVQDGITESLLQLPSNGFDPIGEDSTKRFVIEETGEVVDYYWVKRNTLHDINKTYKFANDKYFSGENFSKFLIGSSVARLLYEIVTLRDDDTVYRRFVPVTKNLNILSLPTELVSADSLISSTVTNVYQPSIDKFRTEIDWQDSGQEIFSDLPKIKNFLLRVYDSNGTEIVSETNVTGLRKFVIDGLDFGDYRYEFELHSEYNKSAECLTTRKDINAYITSEELYKTVTYTLDNPIESLSGENGKKYLLWRWNINHESATDIQFCYSTDKGVSGKRTNAKVNKEFQSEALEVGSVVTYWFKVKSPYIDKQVSTDEEGYVEVNKRTYVI